MGVCAGAWLGEPQVLSLLSLSLSESPGIHLKVK